jgi:hypothetical protein
VINDTMGKAMGGASGWGLLSTPLAITGS